MKYESLITYHSKDMANVKGFADRQTDRPKTSGCVHSFTSGKDDVFTNGYYWYHCLPKVLLVATEL
jgi:hypothetical protein